MSTSPDSREFSSGGTKSSFKVCYPDSLGRAETILIDARRSKAGMEPGDKPARAGLALSGGGIRSATFCLGVLQSLAGAKVLKQIDYLSTVSGGGYVGSFLGAWINREGKNVRSVERDLPESSKSPEVGFLRENGRYIAPNGSGDMWAAFAAALRSWVALLFLLGVFVFAFLLLAAMGRELLWTFGQTHLTCLARWAAPPRGSPWFWPSLWWAVALCVAWVVVAPLIAAYWLLGQRPRTLSSAGWTVLVLVVAGASWSFSGHHEIPGLEKIGAGTDCTRWLWLASGIVTLAAWGAAFAQGWNARDLASARRWLTDLLAGALGIALALALFGVVDSLAATCLARHLADTGPQALAAQSAAAAVIAVVKFAWPLFSKNFDKKKRVTLPISIVAGAGAALLALALLTLLDYWALRFAHAVGAQSALGFGHGCASAVTSLLGSAAALLLLCWVFGRPLGFVNLSSLHQLYSARLTRAYLGASNANRMDPKTNPQGQNITEPVPGDDVAMTDYRPHEHGGPLHIINVTVNETISAKSQIEQRDRKGMGMAIGPAGISLGRVHHALFFDPNTLASFHGVAASPLRPVATRTFFSNQVRVFALAPPEGSVAVLGYQAPSGSSSSFRAGDPQPPAQSRSMERLALGSWVGISGAAVSTGMGANTSVGVSFLAGIFNVRLGYWWNSGVKPGEDSGSTQPSIPGTFGRFAAACFPAQMLLLDELLARFHGTGRRQWYLSDGGHFENTAAYELIRRRVPIIIVCDCGADPGYDFEDVGNLVHKARLDFDAEIVFTAPEKIKDHYQAAIPDAIGTLDDLRQTRRTVRSLGRISTKHAAIALVYYERRPNPESVLLLIKPTMTGEEPPDLLNYRSTHRAFPQEPTAEQFFDEAQWEGYRKLGELIGEEVFPETNPPGSSWLWDLAQSL
jgi:hypothetical protein